MDILELKYITTEIKTSIDDFYGRLDPEEEEISELEDSSVEYI